MENAIRNELQPFFEIHDSRYMMYWLALSESNYQEYLNGLAKAEQERQALEAKTIDKVQPGEQQPETDHQMETDRSNTGSSNDVHFRDALECVNISYEGMSGIVSRCHQFFCFCLQAGIQALHEQTFRVKLHRRDRGRNPDRG